MSSVRVLHVVYGPTDALELLRTAQSLRNDPRLDQHVLVEGSLDALEHLAERGLFEGLTVHGGRRTHAPRPGRLRQAAQRLPPLLQGTLRAGLAFSRLLRSPATWAALTGQTARRHERALSLALERASGLLAALSPDVVVLPLESVGHGSQIIARAAKRAGLPVAIVPYAVPVNKAEVAERWLTMGCYHADRRRNRRVADRHPQWVTAYGGRRLLRLRADEIVAQERLGLAPAHPWRGGGLVSADRIAVESPAMREFYLAEGFDADRLAVTGTVVDDVLAAGLTERDERRRALFAELDLPADRPMMLVAFPPDLMKERAGLSVYDDFRALTDDWLTAVSRHTETWNVVVRPHPSLPKDTFAGLDRPGLRFTGIDTAHLVPLADLYVSCVSATIRWAVTCGIPVLNFDFYRFGYTDFDAAPGMIKVDTGPAFHQALDRFAADATYRAELAARQREARERWGQIDGQAGHRIAALLVALAGRDR